MSLKLNYHHLYYFKVIATEGSISKASQKLRLGQPTVSTQLKQLEDHLGVQLFIRKNRSLILTESGRMVLSYANEIFKLGDELLEVLKDNLNKKNIHLQLGAMDSIPKQIIVETTNFALKEDSCNISILEGSGDFLLRELLAHRLDLIITNYPPHLINQTIYTKKIATLPIVIFGSEKFIDLKNKNINHLNQMPFILPTHHSKLRADINHFMNLNQIKPNIILETQDTSLQIKLAINSLGLIAIPKIAAIEFINAKKLFELFELSGVYEEFFLTSTKRKIENPVGRKIFENFIIN